MFPDSFDVKVGGPSKGAPIPLNVTIGPKLTAVLMLLIAVAALWLLAKAGGR